MRKHGLAPNYNAVPSEVLKAKAERGTMIHKEIEDYIKRGKIGFTTELEAFRAYTERNGVFVNKSEFIVNNDIVAGTVDLLTVEEGENIIADIKTTATLHKDAVAWQLSIYARLYETMTGEKITRGQAYHFDAEGFLTIVEIPLKPAEEVEKLFECERNGEIYKRELTVNGVDLAELYAVENMIKQIEEEKKAAEARAADLRAALMDAMEKNSVSSYENELIKITYVAPTTRTAIDQPRLKKEMPEIAEKYAKTSNVKASLRITIKEA
jgi:hypothetical protein